MHETLKRIYAAAAVIILFAATGQAADWNRGVALYNKSEYRQALAEFQDIVRDRPDVAGAWYYIGLCEFRLKRYSRVQLPLERAIELLEIQSPSSADIAGAWYTIGFSHYLMSDYEKAVEPLRRYLDLAAKEKREVDQSARTALGRAYFFLEKYDDALAVLATTSTASPAKETTAKETAANAYYVGVIHFKREDDDRAIAALREAAKADPQDLGPLDLLAESLLRKGRKTNSAQVWAEAVEVSEQIAALRDDDKTANLLGRAYLGAQKFDLAVKPLEKLARANRENGQAWLYYGIALSRSGQMRKAMEALEITIQLSPESAPALLELGYVYETDKQYQQALRIYEKAFAATNDPAIKDSIERVRQLAAQQP